MTKTKQDRLKAGIGLREFARIAGIGKDVVARIERDLVPVGVNYGDVVRYARAARRAGLTKAMVEDLFPVA
jgi:transcriptional regulator with XRE-family HTH domain